MAAFVSKSNSLHYSVNEAQQNSTVKEDEIEKTLKLLEDGEKEIELNEQHRNVTLVLGITGSGKSSFVQWFAGDASKLISVEKEDDEDEYIIKDESRISNSTTESKTIFPELVVDLKTNNAFYDCPGFVDTRNASIDIAGTYFVKKVTDFAQNIRMLLLVDHPSVEGVSRSGLTSLLKHSTDLVKNVDKYSTSIALVATKVKNFSSGGKFKTTEKIINSIGSFLLKVKGELIEKGDPNDANAIKLLDVLLHQNSNQTYSRIGIFRKPNQAGPLSEIPLMVEGKKDIGNMVETLDFTSIDHHRDFGYAISDSSKNYINGLVNQINGRMWQDADTIAKEIAQFYQQFVNQISFKINSFVTATESVDADLVEAKAFASKLKVLNSELLVPNVTFNILLDKFNYILNAFEIDTVHGNVERIALQAKHLQFLQAFSQSTVDTNPWESLLKSLADSLSNSNKVIQQEIKISSAKLTSSVKSTINVLAGEVWNAKLRQMQSMNIQKLPTQLEHEISIVKNQTVKPNNLEQLVASISKNVESLGLEVNLIKSNTLSLVNLAKYLSYLQAISDQQLETWSPEWTSPLVSTVKSFYDSLDWYRFLNDLYFKLGEYEFQQETSRYNVNNLDYWGEGQSKAQDIQIGEHNFDQFLNKLSQYNLPGLVAIKDIQVAQWQLDELNNVLRITLKHGEPIPDCSEKGKIFVAGDYLKFSDLKQKLVNVCPNSTSVSIFASNAVFIDSDLDLVGAKLKFTLMAPKWEVVGQRRINLDGSPGRMPDHPKANNGKSSGNSGENGHPGLPGGSAGSFLGVGQLFVNGEKLTITANGGVGGKGQEAGDGQSGMGGKNAQFPTDKCVITGHYELDRKKDSEGICYYTDIFRIYGEAGGAGGRGGDGGVPGIGGKQGQIQLYNLNESNMKEIKTFQGNNGACGYKGRGGSRGQPGDNMLVWCSYNTCPFTPGWKYENKYQIYSTTNSFEYNDGEICVNRENIQYPEPASTIEHPEILLNEYKDYLKRNSNDINGRFKELTAILEELEKITFSNGTFALAGKLGSLEVKIKQNLNHNKLISSYESLVNQIDKYGMLPKFSQNKKMLSHLSETTLNKLYNLNSFSDPNLTYNVDGFLNYAQEIMDILNKLRNQQQHEIVQLQLANLIVNSNSTQFASSTDPQLLSVAKELETLIRSNFVLQQYDSVIVVLKKVVFPYAHFYVDEAGFNRNSNDIEYLIDNAVASLDKMRLKVNENRSSVWRVDDYAHSTDFDSAHVMTSPFHIWTNGEHKDAIGKLLSGEPVVLNADIRLSDSNKDAIKFTLLEINLKAKNSTAQAEINTELNKFMVSATHMGNSNYRYGDKYYRINSAPLHVKYSFLKDSNGLPKDYNAVYWKIKSGDLMASPYAMWQIQLSKMTEMVSFDRLAKYRDDVDLELVGQGIFSDSQRARRDYLQVERYYSEYQTRAQTNVTDSQQLNSVKVMKVSNSLHRSSDRVPTQAINSTGPLSYISRLGETVSNLFGNSNSTVNTHHIAHPRFDYTRQHNDNTNNSNLSASSNSVDVHGNLLMGQLLVGLIAGKNNTIANESYISPEQTRAVQVESLAERIVPALSQSSATRSSQLYNSNNQWHRDLMSENVTSREHN